MFLLNLSLADYLSFPFTPVFSNFISALTCISVNILIWDLLFSYHEGTEYSTAYIFLRLDISLTHESHYSHEFSKEFTICRFMVKRNIYIDTERERENQHIHSFHGLELKKWLLLIALLRRLRIRKNPRDHKWLCYSNLMSYQTHAKSQ